MNETGFTAWVMGDDELVEVDVRDLDDERLRTLRAEAGSHGDDALVATIDSLLTSR